MTSKGSRERRSPPTFVQVAVPPLAEPLTYAVPQPPNPALGLSSSDNVEPISVGSMVEIPLGNRKTYGFVVSTEPPPLPDSVKPKMLTLPRGSPVAFPESQLRFFQWIADYHTYPLSQVLEVAVPRVVEPRTQTLVEHLPNELPPPRGSAQKKFLELLRNTSGPVSLELFRAQLRSPSSTARSLAESGHIKLSEEIAQDWVPNLSPVPEWAAKRHELSNQQNVAVNAITTSISALGGSKHHSQSSASDAKPQPAAQPSDIFLLHGVTGSGKTEVYLDAASHALSKGLGVIIMVPEIALTPQLIDRFRGRLGNHLATLHSALPPRERWGSWQAIRTGQARLALGARSALFSPMENIGLIVVDEEHDGSYKQSDGLRYHARDLAIVLASMHRCPVVLGSATPSLESFHHATAGKYRLLSLPVRPRAGAKIDFTTVNLSEIRPKLMPSENISPQLHEALTKVIQNGEQAFLLYNRRGFAAYLQCDRCGNVCECPNCSVSLTFHQNRNNLMCHYCGHQAIPPSLCTSCLSSDSSQAEKQKPESEKNEAEPRYRLRGGGTERIFDEVRALFPGVAVDRLDRDAADDLITYRKILNKLRSGETQVLVGTQMIAKGHDLPNVTLVGIVDADVGLHMPDFRAGERVFQLLTQASGRAGRGTRDGHVVLQTRLPKHRSIQATLTQDFPGFAKSELETREDLRYPPFSRLMRIVISSEDKELPLRLSLELRQRLGVFISSEKLSVQVIGPAPAPLHKLKALWRVHLLLKAPKASALIRIAKFLRPATEKIRKARVVFDIDPVEMM